MIRNLPEIKSKLDDAKKFMGGLIDRGKREMAQKKIQRDLKKIEHKTQQNKQRPQSTIIVTRDLFEGIMGIKKFDESVFRVMNSLREKIAF